MLNYKDRFLELKHDYLQVIFKKKVKIIMIYSFSSLESSINCLLH